MFIYSIMPDQIQLLPFGIEYRVLSTRIDLFGGYAIQTSAPLIGYTQIENCYPNGSPIVDDGCLAPWEVVNAE
jgi:hypothetical protein